VPVVRRGPVRQRDGVGAALLEVNETTNRRASFGPDESVRSIQLYATNPVIVSAAVRKLVDEDGVDHVDLNVGCPSPKVTRRGGGSALPAHPVLFGDLVRAAVRAAGDVPVTVKMRKGVDDEHLTYLEPAAGRRTRASRPSRCTRAPPSSSTAAAPTGRHPRLKAELTACRCSATATSGPPPTPCA
jgi:hypothetical protein